MFGSLQSKMSNDKIRQRVQNIYAAFVTDVDPYRLSDYLKQEGIISIEQWQEMCGKYTTTRHRCRALLDFLLTGNNPRAFLIVRNVLEKENHYLLGAIDDDPSSLTEDKKTIKRLQLQLQSQVESTQVLEMRLQQTESERDKLRKKLAELEKERDRYNLKKERQSNKTHLDELSKTPEATDKVKGSETEKVSQSVRNATVRQTILRPTWKIFAERYGSVMNLTEDPGDECLEEKIQRRGVSFRDGTSNTGQKSSTFRPSSSRLSLGEVQLEPYDDQQNSATLRPLSSTSSAPKRSTLRSSGRRVPLGSTQYDLTQCKADPYLIKEIKTRASKDNCKAIHGLAILDYELFIISRVSSNIEVHDAYRLVLVRCVELKLLEVPWDIVSCKINKCLYIMNWKDQSKQIVRIDSNGNVIKQWSTGSHCGRLSITHDSSIILAAYKSDKIIEYTAEGGLVREIKLSYQLAHPQHAIKLNSSRFLVIHGMYDDFQQRLCLLDSTGCVLASFGGEKGSGKEHLHGPIYMAVDRAGTIFVAEYANSRVLVLSRSLKFMRVLLSKEMHELRDPWSIHLDEANGRLFVVDNDYEESTNLLKDGRILVFYIQSLYLLLANEADFGVNPAAVLRVQSNF